MRRWNGPTLNMLANLNNNEGVKMKELVYYFLDDTKNWHHKDEIFSLCFETREMASKKAKEYLKGIMQQEDHLVYQNHYIIPYSDSWEEFRPINIKITEEDCGVSLRWNRETRLAKRLHKTKTVVIDGEEYSKEEKHIDYKPWAVEHDRVYKNGSYVNEIREFCYNVYICEKRLKFYEE